MVEIIEMFNQVLLIKIPFPFSMNTIMYFNLYGLIIVGFMLSLAIYIINRLMK